jgi:hypothetical protein
LDGAISRAATISVEVGAVSAVAAAAAVAAALLDARFLTATIGYAAWLKVVHSRLSHYEA